MNTNDCEENHAGGEGSHSELLLQLIHQEAQEAVGCTEPAMVALAAAKARALAGEAPEGIDLVVSVGVMKNAQAVGLPGTDLKGLDAAVALGAVAGDAGLGLQVLSPLDERGIIAASELVSSGRVRVACDQARPGLFARVDLKTANHAVSVTVDGSHTNFSHVVVDGVEVEPRPAGEAKAAEPPVATLPAAEVPAILSSAGAGASSGTPGPVSLDHLTGLSFDQLYQAAMDIDLDRVAYLVDGAERNLELAERTLRGESREAAPDLVRSMREMYQAGVFGGDLTSRVRLWAAAAVSARMGGTPWPVLTSGGSGNQGILVSIPLMLAAREHPDKVDRLPRALVLAHAVNLYIKSFSGELSALCGNVTGGAGVAAGVCWLLGGGQAQVERAIEIVTGGLYATVCDGAKGSCALKIGEGAADGLIAGHMARLGGLTPPGEGLVGKTIDETVRLVGELTRGVLNEADRMLLKGSGKG